MSAFSLFYDHLERKSILAIGELCSEDHSSEALDSKPELLRVVSLSYELKNNFESLKSNNSSPLDWPNILSFDAHTVVILEKGKLSVAGDTSWYDSNLSKFENKNSKQGHSNATTELKPELTYQAYKTGFDLIQQSLKRGDIYELNYCVNAKFSGPIVPIDIGLSLMHETQATFTAIANFNGKWILSGSPERFLKRAGNKLTCQPIKGTAKRSDNSLTDYEIAHELTQNPKERSENIMIVDLVRNDLSRIAQMDTVQVEELCELYSFKTVHQLISTISCQLKPNLNFTDILKATFPMGSMTGAPKISAMALIDEFESFKRGHYSGSLGYQTNRGDFDFNVLIRSIFYDSQKQIGIAPSGGAITIESECKKEYEEVLLKLKAMQNSLQC